MNAPIQRQNRKTVAVLKDSLSRKEADEIVDRSIERGGPFMSLAESRAHAAQLRKERAERTIV